MSKHSNQWQLQEAKNKLSQVVKAADQGEPQYISVRGEQKAVVLSARDFERLTLPDSPLAEALQMPILDEDENDLFERVDDLGRDLGL